jgi:hypothetical protein
MKLFIPLILLFFVRGFSQPYLNTIEDFNLFISKQKFIKLEKGPYKIPEDTNQYFFVGKMIDGSYYFFYKHKVSSFKLNDTYEYKSDDEFNKKLQELKITEQKDSVIIVKKENEKVYRDQTIIIYDTENKKTLMQGTLRFLSNWNALNWFYIEHLAGLINSPKCIFKQSISGCKSCPGIPREVSYFSSVAKFFARQVKRIRSSR